MEWLPCQQPLHCLWQRTCYTATLAHREAHSPLPPAAVTGLPVSTYFSAYKLKWLLQHSPAVAAAVAAGRCMFGTVDSWLIYQLTGGCGCGCGVYKCVHGSVHGWVWM